MNRKINQKQTLFGNRRGAIGLALVLVSALLAGCSDTTTTPPVSQSGANAKTSAAATKATTSAFSAASSGTSVGKPDGSSGNSDGGFVNRALESLKGVASLSTSSKRSKALLVGGSGIPVFTTCAFGGTTEITTTVDETGTTIKTVSNQCVDSKTNAIEHFENGTTTVTFGQNNFSITYSDFTEGERDVTNPSVPIKIREEKTVGTFSISNAQFSSCQTETFFAAGSMNMNATFSEYKDEDGNGTPEVNEVFTMTNFTISVTDEFNQQTCASIKETFVANGTIAFTDQLVSSGENNFSATLTNFTSVTTPATGGENETLTGTVAVTTNCENGTFEISTVTPMFYSNNPGSDDCPTAGKLLVTGGGVTSAVTFTALGGVQIDEGNNGTIDKTFADCDDADVCKT